MEWLDLLHELLEEQTSKFTRSHQTELCLDTLRELLLLLSLPRMDVCTVLRWAPDAVRDKATDPQAYYRHFLAFKSQ